MKTALSLKKIFICFLILTAVLSALTLAGMSRVSEAQRSAAPARPTNLAISPTSSQMNCARVQTTSPA